MTPTNSKLTVTTAGTRVQCTADTNVKPSSVYFEALGTNTGYIYVGLVTVSGTVYIARLAAGQGFTIAPETDPRSRGNSANLQLSDLYVDASVSGEAVQMTYIP